MPSQRFGTAGKQLADRRVMARRPTLPPLRAGMLLKDGRSRRVRPCRSPGPGDPTRQPVRPRAGQRAPHRGRRLRTASGPVPGPAGQRAGCGARAEIDKRRAKPAAGRCGGGRRAQRGSGPQRGCEHHPRQSVPGSTRDAEQRELVDTFRYASPIRSLRPGRGTPELSLGDIDGPLRRRERCADRRAPCCRPAGPRGRVAPKLQSRRSH